PTLPPQNRKPQPPSPAPPLKLSPLPAVPRQTETSQTPWPEPSLKTPDTPLSAPRLASSSPSKTPSTPPAVPHPGLAQKSQIRSPETCLLVPLSTDLPAPQSPGLVQNPRKPSGGSYDH